VIRLSQKCQYAIRAILELARRGEGRSATITELAEAQDIPAGFLAVILTDLRRSGLVESRRGMHGGYALVRSPRTLSVAEVIDCMEGSPEVTTPRTKAGRPRAYVWGDGVLAALQERAVAQATEVFTAADFAALIEQEMQNERTQAVNYII
jgi:Rrf2 family protein